MSSATGGGIDYAAHPELVAAARDLDRRLEAVADIARINLGYESMEAWHAAHPLPATPTRPAPELPTEDRTLALVS